MRSGCRWQDYRSADRRPHPDGRGRTALATDDTGRRLHPASVPVAGTAGNRPAWTGAYGQVKADYRFNPNLTGSLEAVHYQVGSALRNAGGRDSNYFRAELKFSW
ncbi:alginate export family protein [Rhizobium ruizarguesonis]